eukprot:4200840-Pyramimonas_sp.AAC.1
MQLRFRSAPPKPLHARAVPAFLFNAKHCQHHFDNLASSTKFDHLDAVDQLRAMKTLMREAVRRARDALTAVPSDELDSAHGDISKEVRGMSLRSIARA